MRSVTIALSRFPCAIKCGKTQSSDCWFLLLYTQQSNIPFPGKKFYQQNTFLTTHRFSPPPLLKQYLRKEAPSRGPSPSQQNQHVRKYPTGSEKANPTKRKQRPTTSTFLDTPCSLPRQQPQRYIHFICLSLHIQLKDYHRHFRFHKPNIRFPTRSIITSLQKQLDQNISTIFSLN